MRRIDVTVAAKQRIVVVGNGLSAFKFCQKFIKYRLNKKYELIVIGDELSLPYDRINLTQYFIHGDNRKLLLENDEWYRQHQIQIRTGDRVSKVLLPEKTIITQSGWTTGFDKLVFATGSRPNVPDVKGIASEGVFVYRSIEDVQRIKLSLAAEKKVVVIGGGILGLEAARAFVEWGCNTTVVEWGSRLMPRQLDEAAGEMLSRAIQKKGIRVLLEKKLAAIEGEDRVKRLRFSDGTVEEADLVVFAAGILPNSELAREAGLEIGTTGGILVNNYGLTANPLVYAIGECAEMKGRIWGLAAPGYEMAEVVAARLAGIFKVFAGEVEWTRLKIADYAVTVFGRMIPEEPHVEYHYSDTDVYRRIVVSEDGQRLLGGILIGDVSGYTYYLQVLRNRGRFLEIPDFRELVKPFVVSPVNQLPPQTIVCLCEEITKADIDQVLAEHPGFTLEQLRKKTGAGTGCESCMGVLEGIIADHHNNHSPIPHAIDKP